MSSTGKWYWQSDLRKRATDDDKEAWTEYSEADSAKIEKAFSKNQKTLSLNDTYSIVFGCMEQQRKDDRSRRRFIRREALNNTKKRKGGSKKAAEEEEEEEEVTPKSGSGRVKKETTKVAKTAAGGKLAKVNMETVFSEKTGGATPAMIAKAEKDLKKTLPVKFKELMRIQNGGGMSDEKSCIAAKGTTWGEAHACIESIIPVEELCEEQDNWVNEWGYPNIGIYFGNCPSGGHDMFAFDYRTCGPKGEPSVVHVDQENKTPYKITYVAPTFGAFLQALQPESAFEEE